MDLVEFVTEHGTRCWVDKGAVCWFLEKADGLTALYFINSDLNNRLVVRCPADEVARRLSECI